MTGFPLLLDVSGRRVLVAGGGAVATRRVRSLVAAGAIVHIVSPTVREEIAALGVAVTRRRVVAADLDGAWLVFACTDDPAVNAAVAEFAADRRIFCVRADAATAGTARVPAVLRRDGLTVAVNGGDDPRRAVMLRDAISLGLDEGSLPSRPQRAAVTGSVALVGGGPGDPELITVRGRRLVAGADVVVVDRLAPRALLDELGAGVEIVDCGKAPHRENLTQDEINALIVDRATAGRRVVRLKGGDPFVFGRGGEELLACLRAGIPVEVVPGISSALAGAAAARIPLTHRGVAADFTVASGHHDPGRSAESDSDWRALARGSSTLVLLMAVDRLAVTTQELIAHGRQPSTPAAVIYRASLPGQRIVRARLADLPVAVEAAGIGPPAVIIVGDVVDVIPSADSSPEPHPGSGRPPAGEPR